MISPEIIKSERTLLALRLHRCFAASASILNMADDLKGFPEARPLWRAADPGILHLLEEKNRSVTQQWLRSLAQNHPGNEFPSTLSRFLHLAPESFILEVCSGRIRTGPVNGSAPYRTLEYDALGIALEDKRIDLFKVLSARFYAKKRQEEREEDEDPFMADFVQARFYDRSLPAPLAWAVNYQRVDVIPCLVQAGETLLKLNTEEALRLFGDSDEEDHSSRGSGMAAFMMLPTKQIRNLPHRLQRRYDRIQETIMNDLDEVLGINMTGYVWSFCSRGM